MSHLEERLAEFVYEELTLAEMQEARTHVTQCRECRELVSEFNKVQQSLETIPMVDVPRRVVFVEAGKSSEKMWLPLRWLVPFATAAALLLALAITGPIHFDRQESSVTIGIGAQPEVEPLQVVARPVFTELQPVEYEEIVALVTAEQQEWLESELAERIQVMAVVNDREIQRLRAELAYLSDLQRAALRDTVENASSIQLLAARTEVQE